MIERGRILFTATIATFLLGLLDLRAESLAGALQAPILAATTASEQHAAFVRARIPELNLPPSADRWHRQARRIRERVLEEVVFRGVGEDWRNGKPRVVWRERIETDHGYSIRKLLFEALPGLWIPALLYEPDTLDGKVPAVLNLNGHDGKGKATPYKQLRCIHQARRGMLALNLEWLGMGQLRTAGYDHNDLAKLDLCGRSGLSVFFLAMSRGLDVLLEHPNADAERVAVTGLSGGGWQTIVLSSLDERVKLCVPVAGYSALSQRLGHRGSIGDLEQLPSDLISSADYAHLTALMVPRPTLLIYNAADDCCFVSATVRPSTFEPVVPFFAQAKAAASFVYYENTDPGTHNYDLDNRRQLHGFLDEHFFGLARLESRNELAGADEVLPAADLEVELPPDNATFGSLADDAAATLPLAAASNPEVERQRLREILRFESLGAEAVRIEEVQAVDGVAVQRYRMQLGSEWALPAVVMSPAEIRRTVLLIADSGYASRSDRIARLIGRGDRVIALDPVLIGQAAPEGKLYQNAMLLATVGERPLGIQTAQLLAVAAAVSRMLGTTIHVEAVGPRSGLIARCAAALDSDGHIAGVTVEGLPRTLKAYLGPDQSYSATPEIYCFGLLRRFDIPQLEQLARR